MILELVGAVNATGWTQLYDGNLVGAAFTMYDTAWAGWFVTILFFVYQFMLYVKTRNLTLTWIVGIIFASIYAAQLTIVKSQSLYIMFALLTFELGGILYLWLWK